VRKNWNGKFTTERIGPLHDADQNARNDHERSDADQNLAAETLAIGDGATAVLRIFSGGSGRSRGESKIAGLWRNSNGN
jgi:hypothetical protein